MFGQAQDPPLHFVNPVGATLVVALLGPCSTPERPRFGQAQDLPLHLVNPVGATLVVALLGPCSTPERPRFGQVLDPPLHFVDLVGATLVVALFNVGFVNLIEIHVIDSRRIVPISTLLIS